jgi:hypothetical protein
VHVDRRIRLLHVVSKSKDEAKECDVWHNVAMCVRIARGSESSDFGDSSSYTVFSSSIFMHIL